jgi:hypothetical protein
MFSTTKRCKLVLNRNKLVSLPVIYFEYSQTILDLTRGGGGGTAATL